MAVDQLDVLMACYAEWMPLKENNLMYYIIEAKNPTVELQAYIITWCN